VLRGQLALCTTCVGPLDAEQRKHRAAVGPAGGRCPVIALGRRIGLSVGFKSAIVM
jgi:hypothetical protein